MAKYCGKCGSRLDEANGLCPKCDAAKRKQHYERTAETETSICEEKSTGKRAKRSAGRKVRRFFQKLILTVLVLAVLGAGVTGALVSFGVMEVPAVKQIIERLGADFDRPADDSQFQSLSGGFTDRKINDKESALEALGDAADMIGVEDVQGEFVACEENTVSGNTYYRFQQEYEGIPVYGRSITVVVDKDGNGLFLAGNYLGKGDENLNTFPKIDQIAAVEIVKQQYGKDAAVRNEGLTFYSFQDCDFELTWKIYVDDYDTSRYCFVSAIDGGIVKELSLTYTERALCSGVDVDGKQQDFYAEYRNGKYIMEDTARNISVYDANYSTLKKEFLIMDSNNKLYHSDDTNTNFLDEKNNIVYIDGDNFSYVITDAQGNVIGTDGESVVRLWTDNVFTEVEPVINDSITWDNNKAVTLISRLSSIYDFWKSEFQRNSFDNNYGEIVAVYNDYMRKKNKVEGDTKNAYSFASPSVPITVLSFGALNSLSMDVVAHEFMHSVEKSISGMSYEAESGALMEAYSDIFGEILEDWSNDDDLNNNCDWVHNGVRNMTSPKSGSALPDMYHGDYWVDTANTSKGNDYGGVHTNNTVISRAAYLMWKGIDGRDFFEALDTEDLAHLFYETLYTLPSDCTFAQFRTLLQNTADIMCSQGRLSEKQRLCVSNAMFQVGITPADTPVAKEHLWIEVYDITGELYDDYTLYVQHGNTEEKYSGKDVCEQGITFPVSGEYQLRIVDNANQDNETVVSVTAVAQGGVEKLPVFTQCGVSKPDSSLEFNEANGAFEKYLAAAAKTTETGAWSEQLTLEADMFIAYDGGNSKTKITLHVNSDVSNYDKADSSKVEISSRADMKVMGQTYAWSTEYKDGVAHYEYTEPFQKTQSLEIAPDFFNFESISSEFLLDETVSDNQIRFTVSGKKIAETGIAAVRQISGISNLEYGDVEVIVTLRDSGSIDQIVMNFDASAEYQGYDADAMYRIQYTFT